VALYIAQGLAGLPVFAGAGAGPAYLMGPTAGFILAWIPMAAIIGYAADKGLSRNVFVLFAVMVASNVVNFLFGFSWLLALSGQAGWLDQSNVVLSAYRGAVEPFMMELPAYKTPDLRSVAFNLWLRAKIFLNRAGRIILPLVIILWVLSTFPYAPADATLPAIDYSFAGMIGRALEPIFAPIGFNWQMVIALIPGMAAREVAVAALGTTYAIADAENATGLLASTLAAHWSLATALSFLAWYIFAPQCVATLGVVKRETNSLKWTWVMIGYMFGLAYLASFVTYHVAVALGGG